MQLWLVDRTCVCTEVFLLLAAAARKKINSLVQRYTHYT